MPRPARAFTAESFALEGRLLLAAQFPTASTVPPPPPPPPVQFESATSNPGSPSLPGTPIQVVTQQAREAAVVLSRTDTAGSLQVEVTTDSSSPYVGVNVGAVDQTVTFADGQSLAAVSVPILAGAPNPGEVDVTLYIKSNPLPTGPAPSATLDLRILAEDPTLPPKVVSMEYTTQGFLLRFNKPMNPAGASDVNNYTVIYSAYGYVKSVKIRTAQYDPATQSVTLIPQRPNGTFGSQDTSLTQVHTARTSVRRGHRSNVAGSLTDLLGNPIDASTTPGKVELRYAFGIPPVGTDL